MRRKERYWVCHSCGVVRRRYKVEKVDLSCPRCSEPMTRARKYPMSIWHKEQRAQKKQRQEGERLKRRHAVLRTTFGSRLRVTAPTREAWRKLRGTKQRRSFVRLGNLFLETLRDDIWSCPHGQGNFAGGRGCDCSGGGQVDPPRLVVKDDRDRYRMGCYDRSFLQGHYHIEIRWRQADRLATLLHEVVHYIDDMSRVDKLRGIGGHTGSFYKRIADLARQLRYPVPDNESGP